MARAVLHTGWGTLYLWVDEGRIRSSPEFIELWQVDSAEQRLLLRRLQQKWGFLYQGLFRLEATDIRPHIDSTQ
jgi:hypothetical protein